MGIQRIFVLLLAACFSGAFAFAQEQKEEQPPLPTSPGIYAVDQGRLTCLTEIASPETQKQRRLFSERLSFLVIDPILERPDLKLSFVQLYDWRHWKSQPPPAIPVSYSIQKTELGVILTVTPDAPLKPGLYELVLGNFKSTEAYGEMGVQTPDSLQFWKDVVADYPESWQGHNHLGAALFAQRQFDEASKHFQRAVEINPGNPEAHNNFGLVLWRCGKKEEAVAEHREAVRIRPDITILRQNLANALLGAGQYEEAARQFQTILQAAPNDAASHASLGSALAGMNRKDEAEKAFEEALRLDPNNAAAKTGLEMLRAPEKTKN